MNERVLKLEANIVEVHGIFMWQNNNSLFGALTSKWFDLKIATNDNTFYNLFS